MHESITQSLAGRTAILNLLPFSISELKAAQIEFSNFENYITHGFLPRIYDKNQRPYTAYSNYYQTYVERDVRQLINLKDVSLFEKFIKLIAGRIGQIMNYNSLASDVGVDAKTIKSWISILEASFIVFKLPPYFNNFGKRIIKSPKYYFIDVGLLSFLLEIEKPQQVKRDPLVGNIFENLIVIEFLKMRYNKGLYSNLYFFRDSNGVEIDLLFQREKKFNLVEIKAAETYHSSFFKNFEKISPKIISKITQDVPNEILIYNGKTISFSDNRHAFHFKEMSNYI